MRSQNHLETIKWYHDRIQYQIATKNNLVGFVNWAILNAKDELLLVAFSIQQPRILPESWLELLNETIQILGKNNKFDLLIKTYNQIATNNWMNTADKAFIEQTVKLEIQKKLTTAEDYADIIRILVKNGLSEYARYIYDLGKISFPQNSLLDDAFINSFAVAQAPDTVRSNLFAARQVQPEPENDKIAKRRVS